MSYVVRECSLCFRFCVVYVVGVVLGVLFVFVRGVFFYCVSEGVGVYVFKYVGVYVYVCVCVDGANVVGLSVISAHK